MEPVIAWLLAGQLVLDLVLVALLGFFVWKARALMGRLANVASGTEWKTDKLAEAFTSIGQAFTSAAASIQLSATAAAASAVAIQTLVRDVRPVLHEQSDTASSVDLTGLVDPDV